MDKLTEVLAMGGYGAFVWPAYGLAAAVMTGVTLISLRSLRKAQAHLQALQQPLGSDET